MQSYRTLLADLPTPEAVTAEARRLFPSRDLLQETYARIQMGGHYLRAKYALASLLDRLDREARLATDPEDEPEIPSHDEGDPVGRADDQPVLRVIDDEEADIGRMPDRPAEATQS